MPLELLIVDDDPLLRGLLAAVFRRMGLCVRTAGDAVDALVAMRETTPDILLADLNMPGMSGYELLAVVRRRLPGLRVIAMSGAEQDEAALLGVAADHFYTKSSELGTLLRMVEAVSKEPRAERRAALWISKVGHDLDGAYAMIACPECLRTFALTLGETRARAVHTTECAHCGWTIEYRMVGREGWTQRKVSARAGLLEAAVPA